MKMEKILVKMEKVEKMEKIIAILEKIIVTITITARRSNHHLHCFIPNWLFVFLSD
jgi:hypothetical protein